MLPATKLMLLMRYMTCKSEGIDFGLYYSHNIDWFEMVMIVVIVNSWHVVLPLGKAQENLELYLGSSPNTHSQIIYIKLS